MVLHDIDKGFSSVFTTSMEIRPDGIYLNNDEMLDVFGARDDFPDVAAEASQQYAATLLPDKRQVAQELFSTELAISGRHRTVREDYEALVDRIATTSPADPADMYRVFIRAVGWGFTPNDPGKFKIPFSLAPQLGRLFLGQAVSARVDALNEAAQQKQAEAQLADETTRIKPGWIGRWLNQRSRRARLNARALETTILIEQTQKEDEEENYAVNRFRVGQLLAIVPDDVRTELEAVELPEDPYAKV